MSATSAKSIQKKLVVNSVALLSTALIGFLATVIFINVTLASRQKTAAVNSIRDALLAHGHFLALDHGLALAGMVEDNAIVGLANLVATTVREDKDLVYGIYMDGKRKPWVQALRQSTLNEDTNAQVKVIIADTNTLEDSISLWASRVTTETYKRYSTPEGDIFEFVATVNIDGEPQGQIRYGLTALRMNKLIVSASLATRLALIKTIGVLILLGLISIVLTYIAASNLARRITRPIEELQIAANAIALGDYTKPVMVFSNDEIGLLATSFEAMRGMVKEYTDRLQEMVAEKIQEIKDVLDNIEQGLFTINLDGKVNADYALSTNAILSVDDISLLNLSEIFRLDAAQMSSWFDWLEMVKRRHANMRWDKLVRLCPVRELKLLDEKGGERVILVDYQKMVDARKDLHKLMILVQDVTEARRVEKMILETKLRHENEVKSILGIVRYAAFIPDFLSDLEIRLGNIGSALKNGASASGAGLIEFRRILSRDLHTIKGTSATLGFEALSRLAGEAEDTLIGKGDSASFQGFKDWGALTQSIDKIVLAQLALRALFQSLKGSEGDTNIPVPAIRIMNLKALSVQIGQTESLDAKLIARLKQACQSIDHVRVAKLSEKYRFMLERVGERLGKRLEFHIKPEGIELSPKLFAALDEPLIHLLRNAADHGIEGEAKRFLSGKPGPGNIDLIFFESEKTIEITVMDDGGGIDIEKLVAKALAMGLVTSEAVAAMNDAEKVRFIFLPGLSSRDEATDLSGRGVGMDVVANWVKSMAGAVTVKSKLGEGTSITLQIPRNGFSI
jgi:signal transduction histidine kinase